VSGLGNHEAAQDEEDNDCEWPIKQNRQRRVREPIWICSLIWRECRDESRQVMKYNNDDGGYAAKTIEMI
jgi:hypothetical protein